MRSSHSTQLAGLAPATTYYYSVTSADQSGNSQTSTVQSFTTAAAAWTETTTADFADGSFVQTAPAAVDDGAVGLAADSGGVLFSDDFAAAASGWTPLDGTWSTADGEYGYTIPVGYSASMITGLESDSFSIESRQKVTASGLSVMGYVWGIQSASPANEGWKNGAYMLQWNGTQLRIFRWASPTELILVDTAATVPEPVVGTWYTLRLEVDGSLAITFAHTAPADTANWLPTPAGPFYLILRLYHPREGVRSWNIPALQPMEV